MKFLIKVALLLFCTIHVAWAASIVIDAGHGGHDPGAKRTFDGVTYLEKNLTLKISQQVAQEFRTHGHDVAMTRTKDQFLNLNTRLLKGRQLCQNAFISVHIDASRQEKQTQAHGATVHVYPTANPRTRKIAQATQRALNPKRRYKISRFRVIRDKKPSCVSMLVEMGYLNNPNDLKKLNDPKYQREISKKLAQSVSNGLTKYKN